MMSAKQGDEEPNPNDYRLSKECRQGLLKAGVRLCLKLRKIISIHKQRNRLNGPKATTELNRLRYEEEVRHREPRLPERQTRNRTGYASEDVPVLRLKPHDPEFMH
ncbi:hypothetical protein FDECE_7342 [Fusarium decemcellulare]|nr:hypothetical protein FDECE_7342 [Fusarium decemcellulare]